MSDNIALINGGRVEQIGSPLEMYDRPRTAFAATFLGNSNLLKGELKDDGAGCSVFISGSFRVAVPATSACAEATLLLRPEHLEILEQPEAGCMPGMIAFVTHFGHSIQYEVKLDGGPAFLVSAPRARNTVPLSTGARVYLAPKSASAYQLIHD
jgi:ABC-type Fe3+/spermidine/putrescine transport system ATPase subunit